MSETSPLKFRIMKWTPLRLELEQERDDEKLVRNFKLAFDFNAQSIVEARTGLSMLERKIWDIPSPINLSVMFHAGLLMHHPEYASDEGLRVVRSYMDAGNFEQINDAINEAFVSSLSPAKQEKVRKAKAERDAAANPTNPATTSAPATTA